MLEKIRELTTITPQKSDPITMAVYAVIAYIAAVLARLTLAYDALKTPAFSLDGRIIPIWTADAGLIGAQAKQILSGATLPYDNNSIPGHLIAWLSSATGLHIDMVMFYAPALFAPLIVIPVVLIAGLFRLSLIGFLAAIFAAVGFNFYFRTHLGYTDTDILIFFFVYMLLYAMLGLLEKRNMVFAIVGFASILMLRYWYHSYAPLVMGLLAGYALFVLLFERRESRHYFALAIFVAAFISAAPAFSLLGAAVVLGVWLFLQRYRPLWLDYRIWLSVSGAAAAAVVAFVGVDARFYWRIIDYLNKKETLGFTDGSGTEYQVEAALKGISEAMGMPIADVIVYQSGAVWLYLLSLAGLAVLALQHRRALLLWMLALLGLASFQLGVRFSTFAIPVLSIGLFTALFAVSEVLKERFGRRQAVGVSVLVGLAAIWINIASLLEYNRMLRPVLVQDQAKILGELGEKSRPEDFVVSWWDNGWPLWYATGMRTVIDNGKHNVDNFLVAKIFFSTNPVLSANMSRYFLEAYAKNFNRESIVATQSKKVDLQELMITLSKPPLIEKEAVDIYYYFNDELIETLPAIAAFATLNGYDPFEKELLSYTYLAKPFDPLESQVQGMGFVLDRSKGIIRTADGQEGRVGRLIISDGNTIRIQNFYRNVDYNVIIYKNRYVLMMTNKYLNTFVIKSFILNRFDPELFELVAVSDSAKILKLK